MQFIHLDTLTKQISCVGVLKEAERCVEVLRMGGGEKVCRSVEGDLEKVCRSAERGAERSCPRFVVARTDCFPFLPTPTFLHSWGLSHLSLRCCDFFAPTDFAFS